MLNNSTVDDFVLLSNEVAVSDVETYKHKDPIFISKRFLKSDERKVALMNSQARKFLVSFVRDESGNSRNVTQVYCYDYHRINKPIAVDAIFKSSDSALARKIKLSHGENLEHLTFLIAIEHRKLFMVRDCILHQGLQSFMHEHLPSSTPVDKKIIV